MKQLNKLFLFTCSLVIAFSSCKKEESIVTFVDGSNPVLTSNKANGSTLDLDPNKKDEEIILLNWTNPDYKLSTGPNTQSVRYDIEVDTTGTNFKSKNLAKISVSGDLMRSLTIDALNRALVLDLQLPAGIEKQIELRVASSIGLSGGAKLYSNVFKFKATPYEILKVPLPASGKLFLVGSASAGGWNNPVPANQEFALINSYTFELTTAISADNSYLLLPVNGSWNDKYGCLGANNTNNTIEDDFKRAGGDFKAPAAAGNYKITVNFKTGRIKLVKQ